MTLELRTGSELTFGPLTPAGLVAHAIREGWDADRLSRSFHGMTIPAAQQLLDSTTRITAENTTALKETDMTTTNLTATEETIANTAAGVYFEAAHFLGKNVVAKELLTSVNFLASSQVYRHAKTLTDMTSVNDNAEGRPDIDQITFAGPQLDSDTALPLWMLVTDATARILFDLGRYTESNDWGLASTPFAYLLEGNRIRTSRTSITSTLDHIATNRAREKMVQAEAFGDMIPSEEFSAARTRRSELERANMSDRAAALMYTLGAYDPQHNIGEEGSLIDRPYAEMELAELMAAALDALGILGIAVDRFLATRLWDTAQNMKKSFLGEINPKTGKAWNIPIDSELILLARKCKEAGLLKLDLVKNIDGSMFDGM